MSSRAEYLAASVTTSPKKPDEGPCFTCEHSVSQITRGYCLKYERTVTAMSGCLDFGSVIYYQQSTRLSNKPKVMMASKTDYEE